MSTAPLGGREERRVRWYLFNAGNAKGDVHTSHTSKMKGFQSHLIFMSYNRISDEASENEAREYKRTT